MCLISCSISSNFLRNCHTRHDGSGAGAGETCPTYSYNCPIPSISVIRMSGQIWKRRYEQFHTASGLTSADKAHQVSTLYCMDAKAEDVLTSTGISDEERKWHDAVMSKLNRFSKVQKNLIFETARFNQRNQSEEESIEQYITALYHLVETCEYGD